jgi:hypothetical protein
VKAPFNLVESCRIFAIGLSIVFLKALENPVGKTKVYDISGKTPKNPSGKIRRIIP